MGMHGLIYDKNMISFFTEPFGYEFFRLGVVAAVLAGGLCGLVGVYVVLRHMSYIGHGLSHAIFGGAVVSYLLKLNFYVGAGLWGFLAALIINQTARKKKIGADAAIGIVTTASFALGVALISRGKSFSRDFEAALFGNILGVALPDVAILVIVSILIALLIFFFYKSLLFSTFDPEVAPAFGIKTHLVDMLFSLILAATIIASMKILGVTLIAASLVIPPTIARLLTDSFRKMILLSTLVGAFCGFFGMLLSWYLDASSGATIVLFAAALFLGTLFYQLITQRKNLSNRLIDTDIA